MTSKFEQLIEFVINDEEAKARELFHDIVVEKSREIYESLMDEEEVEESVENDGDAADDLITDVETEEEGMNEEEEEFDSEEEVAGDDAGDEFEVDAADEFGSDADAGEDNIEDRVVDLEDKLDELMAEFEAMMGGEEEQEFDMDAGGDAIEMDDTSEIMPEMGMMEAVSLTKVAAAKMGDDGANTKSIVPHNSGAKGMAASPVKMTGYTAQGRPAPSVKDMGMTTSPKQGAAPKPVTTQAAGVNTKSPV